MEKKLKPILNLPPEKMLKMNLHDEETIGKVLAIMKKEEEKGELPIYPEIIGKIEKELKLDNHDAHRVFLMAMQKYTPGIKHKKMGEHPWEIR